MSCLNKAHRINTQVEFNRIYKTNKRWHTHSFIVFYQNSEDSGFAFVSSKKVGNSVKRTKARRLLRALVLENEKKLKLGRYIFVSKSELLNRNYNILQKDFSYAIKKLGLFK